MDWRTDGITAIENSLKHAISVKHETENFDRGSKVVIVVNKFMTK